MSTVNIRHLFHIHRYKALVLLPLFLFFKTQAQETNPLYDLQPFHMGFYIAPGVADFKIVRAENYFANDTVKHIGVKPIPGFEIGFLMDFRIGDHFNFRILPGIGFVQRNMVYTFSDKTYEIETESINGNLPILLKYKSVRYKNTRFYVVGGATFTRDFASEEDAQRAPLKPLVPLKANRMQYEFGVGFDFYFDLFKFSPEIRLSRGITNALSPDEYVWTSALDGIYTRLFEIKLQFE